VLLSNTWVDMRISLLMICMLSASLVGQEKSSVLATLEWGNVASTYRAFVDLKPTLVNGSKVPIYLSRLYPNGYAQLERFNEQTGEWEMGRWGITCASVVNPTVPIEIKPNSRREIYVYWQPSVDDRRQPTHFVVYGTRATRSLEGRYRFALWYALEPWTLIHHPSARYRTVSPEFLLLEP
jgi:hypothetical protein